MPFHTPTGVLAYINLPEPLLIPRVHGWCDALHRVYMVG